MFDSRRRINICDPIIALEKFQFICSLEVSVYEFQFTSFSVKWFNSLWEVLEKPENHHQKISIKALCVRIKSVVEEQKCSSVFLSLESPLLALCSSS